MLLQAPRLSVVQRLHVSTSTEHKSNKSTTCYSLSQKCLLTSLRLSPRGCSVQASAMSMWSTALYACYACQTLLGYSWISKAPKCSGLPAGSAQPCKLRMLSAQATGRACTRAETPQHPRRGSSSCALQCSRWGHHEGRGLALFCCKLLAAGCRGAHLSQARSKRR